MKIQMMLLREVSYVNSLSAHVESKGYRGRGSCRFP
jgi:hypothetical protein